MKLESYSLGLPHPISSRALTSPLIRCPVLCGLRFSEVYPEEAIGYGPAGPASFSCLAFRYTLHQGMVKVICIWDIQV